jgi:hypothetical protein
LAERGEKVGLVRSAQWRDGRFSLALQSGETVGGLVGRERREGRVSSLCGSQSSSSKASTKASFTTTYIYSAGRRVLVVKLVVKLALLLHIYTLQVAEF